MDGDGDENDRLETGEKTSLGAVYLLASRDCQSLQFPGSFRGALEPHFFGMWTVEETSGKLRLLAEASRPP